MTAGELLLSVAAAVLKRDLLELGQIQTDETPIGVQSQEPRPKIAAILSVMETCKRLQINLRKYLNDVLPKLPSWPINHVAALSPAELESPARLSKIPT
jgi:hypothetical protein